LIQGCTGCVAAGEVTQQPLQGQGRTEALQIRNQGQSSIGLVLPADGVTTLELHPQGDRLRFGSKARDHTAPLRPQTKGLKTGCQCCKIAQHGWQDGQVGHEPMPALPNPSQNQLSIRWPLPPQPGLTPPLRLGVLASGSGSNFEALVNACRGGVLEGAAVVQLIVNNPGCGAQQRADRLGVPWQLVDHRQRSRLVLDQELVSCLQDSAVDLVVMAGWMRIVTPVLIAAYAGRLVNIHPSLLPSFRGMDAVGQALAAGVRLSGCTVHLVAEEVDAGEILMQAAVPVLEDDDHSSLSARIQDQEHRLLPAAVALLGQRLGSLAQG